MSAVRSPLSLHGKLSPMDEQIMVRRTSEDDGMHSMWALMVGSEPVVVIRTADTVPKAKAIGYLFRELVSERQ